MKNQVARTQKRAPRPSTASRKPALPCAFPEPNDRLTYVLWKAQHAVERKLLQSVADLGLHMTHFGIMRHLAMSRGLTGAEIARRHDVTPQSISSAVADLRKRGFVRASSHPVHRGLVELELTEAGLDALNAAQARVLSVENELVGLLSAKERQSVLTTLIRVRDAFRK